MRFLVTRPVIVQPPIPVLIKAHSVGYIRFAVNSALSSLNATICSHSCYSKEKIGFFSSDTPMAFRLTRTAQSAIIAHQATCYRRTTLEAAEADLMARRGHPTAVMSNHADKKNKSRRCSLKQHRFSSRRPVLPAKLGSRGCSACST